MLFAGLFTYSYGQDVRVNINNQDYSSNGDCEFKIQGICSSEDIGGVEIQGKSKWDYWEDAYRNRVYAVLTNYNPFTVTVLVQGVDNDVHSVVLRANETKEVMMYYRPNSGVSSKPLPSESTLCPIEGMIVRKLGQ